MLIGYKYTSLQSWTSLRLPSFPITIKYCLKNKFYGYFSWIGFNCFKDTEPLRNTTELLTAKSQGIPSTQHN